MRHNGTGVREEVRRQTVRRQLDEPKLEVGAIISLKDGTTGIVLARYIASGRTDEVCYVVERITNEGEKEHLDRA